ncbi:MAG: class IV adenylate cyclase [Planctomycetota bacterium]
MTYEVELKFPLADTGRMQVRLDALGAVRGVVQEQCDQYFAHPVRDFASTDEALRIRSIGDENRITYKGPVIDKATKTRHESELTFQPGSAAAEQLAQIWEQLGFRRVRVVKKSRQLYSLRWQERDLEICLDQVAGLGEFLEIETLADAADKTVAQQTILSLAAELQLSSPEQRSYLEMLLVADGLR